MDHSCYLSSMENTLIYSCANAFEGGISSGSYSSQKFICKNTTILIGKREMNDLQKKERMSTTESQSFSLCEWEDCTAPQGGALYVHDNSNSILTVENSSFLRCNASSTRGGGIYALRIAECIVHHSTFVQCSAAEARSYGGGGIQFETIEWLRNDFGKVKFVSSAKTQLNAIDAFACGLNESYPCRTIYHCLVQLIPGYVTDIEVFSGTITETKNIDCGTNSFTIYGQSNLSSTIQIELEASGLSLFSVSTGTLSVGDFVLVHDSAHENNRGSRLFEISGAGKIHIRRLNISTGSGQSSETAFTTELINIQNGVLQMENVNWAKTISTNSLFSLSSTNEISLELSECTFDGIERTTSGAAVISFSNDKANVDLNCCIFEGCGSRTSADGGSMMLCVGNGNEVKVKGGSFDGCYCSATYGFGGGILLRLLNENSDFLISSSFGTNTAKWGNDIFVISPNLEVTAKSQNITCVTDSLDSLEKVRGYDNGNTSVAIPLCIYLLPTPEEIHVSNTEASDHSHCGIVQFPCLTMKHSLSRLTGEKKVVVNGMILMSDELAFAGQKHEIKGNDDESGWTVSDSSLSLNPAMISASVETELSKLICSLPSSFSSHSTFISSSSSSLTLSYCSITLQNPSSELTFLFLSVESGILNIDSFSALSISLRRNPLISLCGSGTNTELMNTLWLNMTNCHFTEIERTAGSGGCVSIDNSNDENPKEEINIEKCNFDRCSVLSDECRGGAINAQLKGNTQINVISCTFTGCATPAEERKIGFGGGMALKLTDDNSSFEISSPIFDSDKPNVAKYGNDLFVESSNLTKSITNSSLPFVLEHLADISLDSMRGFDGSDTTNAIPLVNFWRAICSVIFIGSEGSDVCVCGFSNYPCLSIDYSLTRLPESVERNINIIGKGVLQKSVDLSGFSIKSDNFNMCSLECLSSLEGAEDAAIKILRITNFELIKFIVPSSFSSGVNTLIHVGSCEGSLTLIDCSFTKKGDDREEITNFRLIKADGGTVQLEFVEMQSLGFSQDIISLLSTTVLNAKNLTMKNIELEGARGLRISKGSAGEKRESNEAEQDVVFEWSSFEEVTQNTKYDVPIIQNDNDEPLKMVIRNTTMKKCGGLKCGKGGGMFCVLNEGGSFECSFCKISECFCSTAGRGGWLFLECTSAAERPLKFMLLNITFRDNSALRGKDVYVRCHSIVNQIADEQFMLDFRAPFVKDLAIWGCTEDSFVGEEDLLLRVMRYQSETIFVSSVAENHADSKQCGEFDAPCHSLSFGVQHIIPSLYSQLLISKETVVVGKCDVHDVIIRSLHSPSAALVHLNSAITNEGSLITTSEKVRIEGLKFNFGQLFSYSGNSIIHEANGQLSLSSVDFSSVGQSDNIESIILNSTLLNIENGILHVDNCSISMLSFNKPSFLLSGDVINITTFKLEQIESTTDVFEIGDCGSVVFNGVSADEVKLSEGCIIEIRDLTSGTVSIGISSFNNCSRNSEGASVLSVSSTSAQISLSNCSCSNCCSMSGKGSVMKLSNATDVSMHMCEIEGMLANEGEIENERNIFFEEICEWNGSLVHNENSNFYAKEIMIQNSSKGGISIKGGNTEIEMGMLENNNPFIEKYPSFRRNIICSDSASFTISSLKGGDGLIPNSSLWILNDGCSLGGIEAERSSPFFIPILKDVSVNENGSNVVVKFKGSLLLPCDLLFRLIFKTGDVELVETYPFEEDGFVSETEVIGRIPSENISLASGETEVSVIILFGKQLAATTPQILKNRTESKMGNDKVVEGGKEGKTFWPIIVIVMAIILFIVLIVSIIFIERWRKAKNENKNLREIVNDTVKKDPKLIEMVTMEPSPEEQWRRAEREAEKKNEERIKKRVYEKSLGHSQSSEHLLSESGSTEYILGRDSDKIPQLMLEKIDEKEEEETRKRTPSPSISSTCSTDSDSTFIHRENMCPTTSSMSNLVDVMACSSPHEKLIVDLRDSLFMLLHGLNKTKEMAIGTLQEREQTAAQILFWVANLALHSFDEMENGLSSLSNLSPHIVLFSEHMVICIVMHSDFSSDDSSDSSSISSSSTIVSSSSDISLKNKRFAKSPPPSSAFEDDDDENRKECLRWKAPELMMNKKMRATKESVSFSIGMMLWECLTLEIPFDEYEGDIAGQKIVSHERPNISAVMESNFFEIIRACLSAQPEDRPSLASLKREFIQRFPPGAAMLTISDAIDLEETIEDGESLTTLNSSDITGTLQTEK
ncbi:uncharacterized protein MONOS_11273 [Monocercomonoides exilis]|uniref:uncharacterized protein n=1 Tax=Monocercomonoides exilis TaxID=2049356 RepID=UPI003559B111|nr:hypothetical protein MONOS_11273 [Monocercomonoides exilis]|eukprot:MONOS_11273.1-p1 / transcript=MONOS_11273.1 / gene=MONOS_11273 / organism=Monocercomonoides_exilis_PA203 / gene_product=unspecified product / transcript_product=unspecified product / location=Mono_scaffold00557:21339-28487(-) / protein_length=2231 / sequence_SO=supercontig / SO=protein_coding / is_pseudo=false